MVEGLGGWLVVGGGRRRVGGEGRGGVVFEAFEREGFSFTASCLWEGRIA